MSIYARLVIGLAILAALAAGWWKAERMLAAADARGYQRRAAEQNATDLRASQSNARETIRRLETQDANQRKQDAELAAARSDAGRNARDAEQLRQQNADAARRWSAALGHTPAVEDCTAAGDAIGVLSDVLSRADRRAGLLASYADAAHAAGLKCERDYDALTPCTGDLCRSSPVDPSAL
ncbi:MAG: DUF2514 family protein [Ramlibacter sp.]|nr:DUF2514 family protein [Ramlibacter sp.]